MLVFGVGAVVLLVPPLEAVYHSKPVPVAVNAAALSPLQYDTFDTVGAVSPDTTFTSICKRAPSHPSTVWLTQ